MILDARDDRVDLHRRAQFAIVGAGPAGMTLARKLADVGPVLVIESGGFAPDPNVQALNEGESVGIDYPLTETRARQFGGSSNLWAGYCAVFDSHDFRTRDWVPQCGWPFGPDAIEPYYAETARVLNLGEPDFNARGIAARGGLAKLPFDPNLFVWTVWRFGDPTAQFNRDLRTEFDLTDNLITLINANVVDLRLDHDHAMVEELTIRTLNGREGRVAADVVVLACGGIETPRILLNADRQAPCGIGNSHDLVGRCFMEHPHVTVESIVLHNADWFKASMERTLYEGNRQYMLSIGLSEEAQKMARVLNARAHIFRSLSSDEDMPRLGIMCEQAPNRDSRVTLSEQTDRLGLRRVRLDWRLTDLDWKTHTETARLLVRQLDKLQIGRACTYERIEGKDKLVAFCNHHIGTTRMAQDPEEGVVDPNCRVHGLRNLFISGSSVFPTSSWANPTFTIVALALRLSDLLREEFGGE